MRIFGIEFGRTRRQQEKAGAEHLSRVVAVEVQKSRQATSELRDTLRGVLERGDNLRIARTPR